MPLLALFCFRQIIIKHSLAIVWSFTGTQSNPLRFFSHHFDHWPLQNICPTRMWMRSTVICKNFKSAIKCLSLIMKMTNYRSRTPKLSELVVMQCKRICTWAPLKTKYNNGGGGKVKEKKPVSNILLNRTRFPSPLHGCIWELSLIK